MRPFETVTLQSVARALVGAGDGRERQHAEAKDQVAVDGLRSGGVGIDQGHGVGHRRGRLAGVTDDKGALGTDAGLIQQTDAIEDGRGGARLAHAHQHLRVARLDPQQQFDATGAGHQVGGGGGDGVDPSHAAPAHAHSRVDQRLAELESAGGIGKEVVVGEIELTGPVPFRDGTDLVQNRVEFTDLEGA